MVSSLLPQARLPISEDGKTFSLPWLRFFQGLSTGQIDPAVIAALEAEIAAAEAEAAAAKAIAEEALAIAEAAGSGVTTDYGITFAALDEPYRPSEAGQIAILMGLQGEDGEDGQAGPPGQAGAAGAAGSVGPVGPQGPIGFGIDGMDGEEGLTIPGSPGPVGPQGAVGPQGPPGFQGVDGEEGPEGFAIPGAAGPTGATGPTGAAGGFALIGSPVVISGSTTSTVVFSIPGGFTHLKIVLVGATDGSDNIINNAGMFFNADTTSAHYSASNVLYGNTGGSALAGTVPSGAYGMVLGNLPSAVGSNALFGPLEIDIYGYLQTGYNVQVLGKSGSPIFGRMGAMFASYWKPSALTAITSVTITALNTGPSTVHFQNGTTAYLYGY